MQVFVILVCKAVLLSYAFTADPCNPPIEILTGSTIIKNYCHYLRYMWFTPPLVPLKAHSPRFHIMDLLTLLPCVSEVVLLTRPSEWVKAPVYHFTDRNMLWKCLRIDSLPGSCRPCKYSCPIDILTLISYSIYSVPVRHMVVLHLSLPNRKVVEWLICSRFFNQWWDFARYPGSTSTGYQVRISPLIGSYKTWPINNKHFVQIKYFTSNKPGNSFLLRPVKCFNYKGVLFIITNSVLNRHDFP